MSSIEIKILTWNIDGLCQDYVIERANSAAAQIAQVSPDVIMLQEVVQWNEPIFDGVFRSNYVKLNPIGATTGMPYYTLTYVKKCHPRVNAERKNFRGAASSVMGRDMLCATIFIRGTPFLVINSHLESTKEYSKQRTEQLCAIVNELREHCGPALVGGDLNMRDTEQKDAFGRAGGDELKCAPDAYVFYGKPKSAASTWTLPGNPHVKARFDRIYHNMNGIEYSSGKGESITMLGTTSASSCGGMPPSDHRGLLVSVQLECKEEEGGPSSTSFYSPEEKIQKNLSGEDVCVNKKRNGSSDIPNERDALRVKRLKRFEDSAPVPAPAPAPAPTFARAEVISLLDSDDD